MARKHLKTSAMAAIVLGCALGVAQAAGPTPPPIDPSQLRTLLKLKPSEPLPSSRVGRLTPGPTVVGWNFKVCIQSFLARTGQFSIFAVNSDGSFFLESSTSQTLSSFQNQLLAACQHAGGGYWVHLINADLFDAIAINYP
jgi:hypothetical protein